MADGEGSKLNLKSSRCYECGEPTHWKVNCPFANKQCIIPGCNGIMKLRRSNQPHSKDRRFFTCTIYGCKGFIWIDYESPEAEKISEANKGKDKGHDANKDNGKEKDDEVTGKGKVKMTLGGKMNMIIEGDIDEICTIAKRLAM